MNGDDEIQARRDERAKWDTELTEAQGAYDKALKMPHLPGNLGPELNAMRSAHQRILHAKHRLDFLRWCDEMDEGRWREETGV